MLKGSPADKPIILLSGRPFPNQLDWESKGVTGRILDQGKCSSQWAITGASTFSNFQKIHYGGEWVELSVQYLLECYDYREITNEEQRQKLKDDLNYKCSEEIGDQIKIENVLRFVLENGIRAADHYPYTSYFKGGVGKCKDTSESKLYKFDDLEIVEIVGEKNLVEALNLYGPIPIMFNTSDWMVMYREGIYNANDNICTKPYHAGTLVGYGQDTVSRNYYNFQTEKWINAGKLKYWKIN